MTEVALTLVLLIVAAGLWYGGRSFVTGRNAPPRVAAFLGRYPRAMAGLVAAVIVALVTLGLAALLALLIGG